MSFRPILLGFSVFLLNAVGAPATSNALTTFTIDSSPSCCTVPAGTVQVSDADVDKLSFTVSLDAALNDRFVKTGMDATFAFNLSGITSIIYSSVSAGFTPTSGSQTAGNLKMDGAGNFGFGLTWVGFPPLAGGQGGSNPGPTTLSFTISAVGLKLSSLAKSAKDYLFAMDIAQ